MVSDSMKVAVCVPVFNAESTIDAFVYALKEQNIAVEDLLLIDSSSTDSTAEIADHMGFRVVQIAQNDFRHGTTRQYGVELLADADVIVFLTQDAILASPESIARLLAKFDDPQVGAAYGRQLPRKEAGLVEAHARLFNYPQESAVRTLESVPALGFKAIFFSNSFGVYRRTALQAVGGFSLDANFGEDTIVAARLLLAGWKIAYAADAEVYHSHAYTIAEEYKRYVRIGKLHASQPWLLEKFGRVNGEGIQFVRSQMKMLMRKAPWLIPAASLRIIGKFVGYKVGFGKGSKEKCR